VNKTRRQRPARRQQEASGADLPTAKELALAAELAARWRLTLPEAYERDLPFVRTFLSVFALDRATNPPELVLRRLRNARQFAWDGLGPEEIARKLELPDCLGPILHHYGLAQVPRFWRTEEYDDAEAPLLDRLTDLALDGDEAAIEAMIR
jgi:hypothetical protein